ncbi:ABC transporter substrate-binding protein [Pseudomonas solani]
MSIMLKPSAVAFFIAISALEAHASTLTVVSLGGLNKQAQQAAFYTPFEQAHGTSVRSDDYNGELGRIKAMVATGSISWDLVEVDHADLQRGCEEGLFEPLPPLQQLNAEDLIDDAISECGVGIFIWSTALTYDAKALPAAPTGWADFWDLDAFTGKRALRKGAKLTLEIALMADGVSSEQVYEVLSNPQGVERAFRKLDQIKPHIQWWETGAQPLQWLASRDVVMTSGYTARAIGARKDGYDFPVIWAGSLYDMDNWAIVKGSRNQTAALQFMQFTSQPDQQARFAEIMHNGPVNLRALDMVSPATRADFPTAPENIAPALKVDAQFWLDHGEELEQRFIAWSAK